MRDGLKINAISIDGYCFIGALCFHFPELRPLLYEHLKSEEGGEWELFPYLFMYELAQFIEGRHMADERVAALFAFAEEAFECGNQSIDELIAVGLIEDIIGEKNFEERYYRYLGSKLRAGYNGIAKFWGYPERHE